MRFTATAVDGVWIVELERHEDERGWFARTWCRREFERHGLPGELAQASLSHTRAAGTIRGLHWQAAPHREDKLVRCVRGAVWDVAVDVRRDSPTYRRHVGVRLDPADGRALFVPKGCAHGFQTLEPDSEVFYQMTEPWAPDAARGARWNDPAFGIDWPLPDPFVHPRDASWPDFDGVA